MSRDPRTSRRLGALASRALDNAARDTRSSNGAIGEQLGVGESRVRVFRSDDGAESSAASADADVTPNLKHMLSMGDELFEALVAALRVARVELKGEPPEADLETLLAEQLVADAQVTTLAARALGTICDAPRATAIMDAVRARRAAEDRLLAALLARAGRRG